MRLAAKLQRWVDTGGRSGAELARRVGVSESTISRWLAGSREPRRPELVRLAQVLGVSLDYLADDDQDEPPAPAVPDITQAERIMIDSLRQAGISPTDVLARLIQPSAQKRKRRRKGGDER